MAIVLHLIPFPAIIALAAAPFAIKAIRITLRESSNTSKLVPALAANVATAYLTITLLAIGYAMSTALGF